MPPTKRDANDSSARRPMVRVGGLWKKQTANGATYLTGKLGFAVVFVFPVKDKQGSQPDYSLYIAEDARPSEAARSSRSRREPGEDL